MPRAAMTLCHIWHINDKGTPLASDEGTDLLPLEVGSACAVLGRAKIQSWNLP